MRKLAGFLPGVVLWLALAPVQAAPMLTLPGVVLGPDEKPIAGAMVGVVRGHAADSLLVQTDAEGRFSLSLEAPEGTADTAYEKAGVRTQATVYAPGMALANATLRTAGTTIRLEKGSSLSGVVKDQAGQPAAGVEVKLIGISGDRADFGMRSYISPGNITAIAQKYKTTTNAEGRWTLGDLPAAGSAQIQLSDPRYADLTAQLSLPSVQEYPLTVKPGASLSGRLVFEGGEPPAKAAVYARGSGAYVYGKMEPDGTYTLNGLPEGSFKIVAKSEDLQWYGVTAAPVPARAGETRPVPALSMQRTQEVTGTYVDDATGKPVSGVVYNGTSNNEFWTQIKPSDAAGNFSMRIPVGEIQLHAGTVPPGYIRNLYPASKFTIAVGQKTLPPIRLKKGLVVRGTAVDENGQPARDALIGLISTFSGAQARVEDNGNWTMNGIDLKMLQNSMGGARNPLEVVLVVQGNWEIVSPEKITVPIAEEVQVVLRRSELLELKGRVRTPDGKPVAGAELRFKVTVGKQGQNIWSYINKQTDAAGNFILAGLRPDQLVSFTVKKTGYAFVGGGETKLQNGVFTASDAILAATDQTLAGRVLDAAGKPAANARVILASGEPGQIFNTNAEGRFEIPNVPAGKNEVLAASGYDFGRVTAATGTANEITLKASPAVPAAAGVDVAKIIDFWKGEDEKLTGKDQAMARAQLNYSIKSLWPFVIKHDPDAAVALITSPNGTVDTWILNRMIVWMARYDPERALQWAPRQIEKMPANARSAANLEFALAISNIHRDVALAILKKESEELSPTDFSKEAASKMAWLIALASRLGEPGTQGWMESLPLAVEKSFPPQRRAGQLGAYAETIAKGSPQLAEKLVAGLEPADQIVALGRAVEACARQNLPGARHLLKRMQELSTLANLPQSYEMVDGNFREAPRDAMGIAI